MTEHRPVPTSPTHADMQLLDRAAAHVADRTSEQPLTAEVTWLDLLRRRVEVLGSKSAAGAEIGYSRSAVSLALAGKYPGNPKKLIAAVISRLTSCDCPYLGKNITASTCRGFRKKPMPTSRPDDLRHWTACQSCPIGARLHDAELISGRRIGGLPA